MGGRRWARHLSASRSARTASPTLRLVVYVDCPSVLVTLSIWTEVSGYPVWSRRSGTYGDSDAS